MLISYVVGVCAGLDCATLRRSAHLRRGKPWKCSRAVRTMLAVREFQDKPMPPESVRRIVEAGRLSGGSMNRQPWHFIVVRESLRFKVENLETFKQEVALLAKADPEWFASKSPNLEAEYNVVLGLLQSCRYGKHQLPDPEGNLIDVSE
jgi:nitroreductase